MCMASRRDNRTVRKVLVIVVLTPTLFCEQIISSKLQGAQTEIES